MPTAKQTPALNAKLSDLSKALVRFGHFASSDGSGWDTHPAYLKIIEDIKDTLNDLQHYIDDYQNSNVLNKKVKSSKIRSKMVMLMHVIGNYTRLVESFGVGIGHP